MLSTKLTTTIGFFPNDRSDVKRRYALIDIKYAERIWHRNGFDNVNWLSIQEVRMDNGNDILLDLVYHFITFKIWKIFEMVLAMVKLEA